MNEKQNKLWKTLRTRGMYTGTFAEFQSDMQKKGFIDEVWKAVGPESKNALTSKTFDEFNAEYGYTQPFDGGWDRDQDGGDIADFLFDGPGS